ncbi:hypothetical protein R5W23_004118 [Gemmata sp. JC673]|uniref:Uncharacterized protein n=1 Tax=Gemmata algarum TaxID=2975278 RepID=A0ABU5F581_9BACT|nr:hypothetical protein [Gemmata algarum]MDY3562644.1 hypothetical protein [Gemmata algarum]
MKRLLAPIVVVALACSSSKSWSQTDHSDTKAVIDKVVSGHKELEQSFGGIAFKGSVTVAGHKRPREYVLQDGMFRLATEAPTDPKDSEPVSKILLRSKKKLYEVRKGSGAHILTSMSDELPKPAKLNMDLFMASPYSSFMFLGRRMTEWIEDPAFKVVAATEPDAGSVTTVSFEYAPEGKYVEGEGYPRMRGTVSFDASKHWAIRKVDYVMPHPAKAGKDIDMSIVVNYGHRVDSVEAPQTVEFRIAGTAQLLWLFQMEEARRVALGYDDFTPKAYGIPVSYEDELAKPVRSYAWAVLAAAGVAAIVVAFCIWRWGARLPEGA